MTDEEKLEAFEAWEAEFERWLEEYRDPELRLSRELKEKQGLPEEVYSSLTRGEKEQLYNFLEHPEDYEELEDEYLYETKVIHLEFLVRKAKEYEKESPWEDPVEEEEREELIDFLEGGENSA